jgi:hypothetical protein
MELPIVASGSGQPIPGAHLNINSIPMDVSLKQTKKEQNAKRIFSLNYEYLYNKYQYRYDNLALLSTLDAGFIPMFFFVIFPRKQLNFPDQIQTPQKVWRIRMGRLWLGSELKKLRMLIKVMH